MQSEQSWPLIKPVREMHESSPSDPTRQRASSSSSLYDAMNSLFFFEKTSLESVYIYIYIIYKNIKGSIWE